MAREPSTLPNRTALAAHLRNELAEQLVGGLADVDSRDQVAVRLTERLAARVAAIEQKQKDAAAQVA